MLLRSAKTLTILSSSLLIQVASIITANAQKPAPTTDLKIIRSTSSKIDLAVETDLVAHNLKPFRIVDDSTFLRRAYVGIIGRIPTYQEVTTFLNNRQPDKRASLIDSLIYSPGYESKTFNFWADLLRLESNDEQYGLGWHVWLRDSVAANKPYNKMVHEMLSATGHASSNPAVGYYLRDRNMLLDNISNTVQVFLGTQIGCAQCHDHPFEDWTQKQYYQLAAFGANIEYKSKSARDKIKETAIFIAKEQGLTKTPPENNKVKGKNKGKTSNTRSRQMQNFIRKTSRDLQSIFQRFSRNEITINDTKTLQLPADYQYNDGTPGDIVKPNPIFKDIPNLHQGSNRLENFANWVTSPNNPQFTKTIANRLWKHVYGYGLAEPLDNWTDRTKVSHPEALALVEKILHKNNYNIRETLRILYHTQLFQRSVSLHDVPQGSTYTFQGPILRRLSAEELHDSFLTLEKGNIDHQKNNQYTSRWKSYVASIDTLLAASPEAIIEINKITDQTEKETNSLKAEIRKIQIARKKASADGLTEEAKKLQKQQNKIYSKINEIKLKNNTKAATEAQMAPNMLQMATNTRFKVNRETQLRASEMPAPSKGRSFLRMFGASDRQTPDASETNASIPQTLSLLNGNITRSTASKKGMLKDIVVSSTSSPSQKLNTLFLSIYARYPTASEQEKYLPLMSDYKQARVLTKAMLNSKRFLFLQ